MSVQINNSLDVLAGLGRNTSTRFAKNGFNTNELRPYFTETDERAFVSRMVMNASTGKLEKAAVPVANANALLRVDQWREIDAVVSRVVRPELRVVAAVRAAGLSRTVSNAFGKQFILSENRGDMTGAKIGMDPVAKSNNDRVEYNSQIVPLPVIWKDFSFTSRELAFSQNGSGEGLDMSGVEEATRKCVEAAEALVLGQIPFSFGGTSVYGLTNFPGRTTASLTLPTASAWTPATTVNQIIAMREALKIKGFSGPFIAVYSAPWAAYFDRDYSTVKGDNTLGQRVREISEIESWTQSETLTGYQIILIKKAQSTFRVLDGMDFRAVQWESAGGQEQHFKIMGMVTPEARSDFYGISGINHGVGA